MNELKIRAEDESLDTVISFIEDQLDERGCPEKTKFQINIAVEELFVNIAHYAYAPDVGDAVIQTEFTEEPRAIVITFIDKGVPYDPLAKADPDVTLPAEQRKIGGLGIYMVKKSMDDIRYEYKDECNILTITKTF